MKSIWNYNKVPALEKAEAVTGNGHKERGIFVGDKELDGACHGKSAVVRHPEYQSVYAEIWAGAQPEGCTGADGTAKADTA